MGLMSWFARAPLSPTKIARAAKLAANPFAQPDVRMRELERLMDDNSAAAIAGALRRLTVSAQGHIADEEEKQWLEDALVRSGEAARAPLEAYIAGADRLTYALRAYARIVGQPAATAHFLAVLRRYGPEDHRSGEAKLQLVLQLGERLDDPEVLAGLAPSLCDHGDDVRRAALELLARALAAGPLDATTRAAVLPPLAQLVAGASGPPRIAQQAAELLANAGWALPGDVQALPPSLASAYFIDPAHVLRRRDGQHVA